MAHIGNHDVAVLRVFGVLQWQVADDEWVFHGHGMRDAVDCAALGNQILSLRIAIDAHHIVPWHGFFPNPEGRCVVLRVVRWQEDRVVHERGVAVGQIVAALVGVPAAKLRRAGDADDIERLSLIHI